MCSSRHTTAATYGSIISIPSSDSSTRQGVENRPARPVGFRGAWTVEIRPARPVDSGDPCPSWDENLIAEEGTMKYLLLICANEAVGATPEAPEPIQPWLDEMNGRGVRVFGDRLQPVSAATTVRVRNGELLVTDGPFAETKEQIAGIDILECKDLDEAIEVASKHPNAKFGTIEVRPFWNWEE
jgi:hypothetical protein